MANRAEGSALRAPTKGGRRMQQITRRSFLWGVAVAAAAVLAGCGSASQPPPEEPTDPEEFEPQTKTLTVSEGQSLTVTVAGFSVGMDDRAVLSLKLHNELGREITLSDSTGDGVLTVSARADGTFVQSSLWQSFSDPLVELLSDHPESQYDLLETRHALEGIAAYYAALRSTDEDKERIRELHHAIELAQQSGDLDAESNAVLQYQIAVTEAAHNVVLLHLLRCMEPMLAQNVRQNFELLYSRREMLPLVSSHRTRIFEAIMAGKPEEAREASHRHLAFIEEILLDRSREESRRERSLRRLEQRKN